MATFIFPGQGSQARGMGSDLFAQFPSYTEKADEILGYSVKELCLEDAEGKLNQTNYTQPALFVVNALSYLKKSSEQKPDYVAGHSLGEYNALFAAGVFDFETGLKLVQKRGALMSQATGGGMAAIIGLKATDIEALLREHHFNDVQIANYNSYTQIVISGSKDSILKSESIFTSAGASLFIPLKVSGAFHSKYMAEASQQFSDFLKSFQFDPPQIPVIANINALPYEKEIHSHLANQMTHSVLWRQSIEYLLNKGEETFEEVGPGRVLTGLVKKIREGQ